MNHRQPITRAVAVAAIGSATVGAAVAGLIAAGPATAAPRTPATTAVHSVHVGGVTLRVPSSWRVRNTKALPGCIVDPAAPRVSAGQAAYGANNCQLQVLTGRTLPVGAVPDTLYRHNTGDPAQCVRNSRDVHLRTTVTADARVGGVAAQYRRFARPCLTHRAEQWFVGRQPGVLIVRTRMQPATEAAAVRAVSSARLPKGHGLPRAFVGRPVGAGRDTVLLARTRLSYDSRGRAAAVDAGGRSRLFRVPASIRVAYTGRGGSLRGTLTRSQFLHDVQHGFPHSGSLQPEVTVSSAVGSSRPDVVSVTLASAR